MIETQADIECLPYENFLHAPRNSMYAAPSVCRMAML